MQNFSIEVFYLEAEEVKDYRAIKIGENKSCERVFALLETLVGDSFVLTRL